MRTITPCLWFDDDGEDAAHFYISVFGGDSEILDLSRYSEAGPGVPGTVMTVRFSLRGQVFTALNGGREFAAFTESISFQVDCADQDEVDHFWSRLSAGGQEGPCGWLKDRFGLSWQIVPRRLPELLGGSDADGARRATEAMLSMGKIVVADLERAYAGG